MTELIFMVNESLEGGFEARALGESIFTDADDIETYTPMCETLSTATLKKQICQRSFAYTL